MSKNRQNIVLLCGKTVHGLVTTCVWLSGLSDRVFTTGFWLGIIPYFSDHLYYFCTQVLHSDFSDITPVKLNFYPLSTPPTITITTNI